LFPALIPCKDGKEYCLELLSIELGDIALYRIFPTITLIYSRKSKYKRQLNKIQLIQYLSMNGRILC
jgi:hypothetical protein